MFTQVRTHFTVNTPRLIVNTCSEDCSEVTKYFFCPPLKNFLIFLTELEIRGLSAGKGPTNRERNLGCDHTRPDSFLCRHETFSGIVWTPIRYVTLHFKRSARYSFTRYRNRAEISVLICEQKPYPLWFLCWRKSDPVLCAKIWKIDQLYQMAGVTTHASRIVFFLTNPLCAFI